MDSDQDIATELERLNIQLTEIAAAEDIYLTATENSPNSECGPADGQLQEQGAFVARCQTQTADTSLQQYTTAPVSSQTPEQHTMQQCSPVKQHTLAPDIEQQVEGHSNFRGLAEIRNGATRPNQMWSQPEQTSAAVNAQRMDLSAASAALQPPASTLQLADAAWHQPQDLQQQQQSMVVQQLLQQHGKLLDLLQVLATNKNSPRQHHRRKQSSTAALANLSSDPSSADDSRSDAEYSAIQQQYQEQLFDNQQLKKRLGKVQKVLLQHLQEARLKAAAAEAAAERAQRREQEALTAAAGLHALVMQQQEHLQQQQHELDTARDQLQQVQELHKQKLAQTRAELKQQYDAQLQATTAAYAQELAQIQAHLAGSRKKFSSSKRATSCTEATAGAGSAVQGVRDPRKPHTAGPAASAGVGTAARRPGPPSYDAADCSSSSSRSLGADARSELLATAVLDVNPAAAGGTATVSRPWTTFTCSAFANPQQQQQQQQQQHSQEMNVPAEVVQYAERYQQGVEGTCRPPTAPPSVLQRRRQQEQPVPEAAAQLAQHFVAGGEGISRPLTAPSSDRCGLLPRRSGSPPPRSSRQPAGNTLEPHS